MSERIIDLSDVDLEGFIWPSASGVKWTNQTHGLACMHPILEGVFIPFDVPLTVEVLMINDGALYAMSETHVDHLDALDDAFAESRSPFRVCRDRLGKSFEGGSGEAWLWVVVQPNDDALAAFEGEIGVLTWTNSD